MTLDEAILHAEEVADRCIITGENSCCGQEHHQLAEWLKELKEYKKNDEWILVNEKLPEINQRVLVTNIDGSMAVRKCIDAGHLPWFYSNILAWKPCSESYQGKE